MRYNMPKQWGNSSYVRFDDDNKSIYLGYIRCPATKPLASALSPAGGQPMCHKVASDVSMVSYYSTGAQIVSCTLSDDSVLSESTGLFNSVLCVSQWNLFWQKNQPMRLCLSNQVRPGREWFPSPLGDFNRLFEGLIGELFLIWHWNMFYFFKWHQSDT